MNIKNSVAILFTVVTLFAGITTTSAAEVLTSGSLKGSFSSWGKSSLQGDWKIVKVDGKTFLELGDNFRAKKGPDVKIILSPIAASDVTSDNALDGGTLVKLLTVFEKSNRIEIPASTDLSQFKSLVFHCEAYSKLWGRSAL